MDSILLSKKYKVRKLTKNDIDIIYDLSKDNKIVYEYHPPFVTKESIIDDSIKTINNNYVALKKGVANIEPNVSIIKKNLGEYKNGTYSFSKTEKDAVGTKDRYTGLNDDVTLKETECILDMLNYDYLSNKHFYIIANKKTLFKAVL